MEEPFEGDKHKGDLSLLQPQDEKKNDVQANIPQENGNEDNVLDSLGEDVKSMDISHSNVKEEKKVDDILNESGSNQDEKIPVKVVENCKEGFSIFETNAWRGNEEEMFELNVEKDGCVEIMEALTEDERNELADPNMPLRHFRAEKGNVKKAITKIKSTIAWRKSFEVSKIKSCTEKNGDQEMRRIMEYENASGKIYARGYDKNDRAVLYFCPGLENSNNRDDNMRHLVYQLERGIACTQRKSGLQKYVIVLDFRGYKLSNAPPMSTTKMTAEILQHHYPERLLRFFICNPPIIFRVFWKMVSPFIDPVTKDKIKFIHGDAGIEILKENFDLSTTEKAAGGTSDLRPFDSKQYLDTPFDHTFDEKI